MNTFFILLAWCLLPLFIPVVIGVNPFAGGGVESRHAGREVLPDSKTCGDYPVNPYGESSRSSARPIRILLASDVPSVRLRRRTSKVHLPFKATVDSGGRRLFLQLEVVR